MAVVATKTKIKTIVEFGAPKVMMATTIPTQEQVDLILKNKAKKTDNKFLNWVALDRDRAKMDIISLRSAYKNEIKSK